MKDELYPDVAMQLLSAFCKEDTLATQLALKSLFEQMESTDEDTQDAIMPGLLFGSMIHLKLIISILEGILELEEGKGVEYYASFYNTFRETMLGDVDFPIRIEDGGRILRQAREKPDFF